MDLFATIKQAALRCILLHVAIYGALFIGPIWAVARIARQFCNDETLVIAPGLEIKLP